MKQNQMMTKPQAIHMLDPQRFMPLTGEKDALLLPDLRADHRIRLAQIVAEDLRAFPPRKNPNGTNLIVGHGKMWQRVRAMVVEQSPKGPVRVQDLIADSFDLDRLAHVLLQALAARTKILESLHALDGLAVFFNETVDLVRESEEAHRRAQVAHDALDKIKSAREAAVAS